MRPRVRTAALTGFAEVALSVGLDPVRLVREVGLHPSDLEPSDRWIPAVAVAHLLELAAHRSGCADLGLRLAGARRLGNLGPISVVLRDEPVLRAALELLIRYEHTYNEALHLRLHEEGEATTLSLWFELGEPAPTWQASDLAVCSLLRVIRTLVGADWTPRSVSFAHDAPADPAPYHRVLGPAVRFGRGLTALEFPTSRLGAAVLTADPSLRPYTRSFLRDVAPHGRRTAAALTGEAIEALLPLGRCSLPEVGRQLGVPPRELQRRLAEEGTTFSSVAAATRARLAERLLQGGSRSLTEIALLLGFAAPSAFSRWFSQHFGTSPSAWRTATASSSRGDAGAAGDRQVRRRTPVPSSGGRP